MPRGDKSKYTSKQKRKAANIEKGYRRKGVPRDEAERRAWATVNKMDKGGKQPGGSGRGKGTGKATTSTAGRTVRPDKTTRSKRGPTPRR